MKHHVFNHQPQHHQQHPASNNSAAMSHVMPPVAATPTPGQTIWVCPMHPEIRRNAPGHCPICGMSLEAFLPDVQDNAEFKAMSRRSRFP